MNKILTIVVPTYNAERYLRDNLDSFLIEEVLADIEVLIINDGSTDSSLNIAKEYAENYPDTYRVITKANGGHGSGINCGIQNARGTYFKVVDADDWVERKGFCRLVKTLKEQSADVIYANFLWAFDKGQSDKEDFETKVEIPIPFKGVIYGKSYVFDEIADRLYMKMHSMTIKTEILRENGIYIDEQCYYVDTEYITYPIPYVNTICFIQDNVYMYRIGRLDQSVNIKKMKDNKENYDKVLKSLLEWYNTLGKKNGCSNIKKMYIARIVARVVAGKVKVMLSFPSSHEKKEELQRFDESLKRHYPEIYVSNKNLAVTILRRSKFKLYRLASIAVKYKYR